MSFISSSSSQSCGSGRVAPFPCPQALPFFPILPFLRSRLWLPPLRSLSVPALAAPLRFPQTPFPRPFRRGSFIHPVSPSGKSGFFSLPSVLSGVWLFGFAFSASPRPVFGQGRSENKSEFWGIAAGFANLEKSGIGENYGRPSRFRGRLLARSGDGDFEPS